MTTATGAPAPATPAAAPNGAPRNNAGQFAPKAGATGVVPQEGAAPVAGGQPPPSGPSTAAEWEGYEGEVDVYGEKATVKVKSKAEALRAHQELLAYRKRVRDIAAAEKEIASFRQMTPKQRAEALGVPVKDLAREEVLQAAREIDMTEDQLRAHRAEQKLAAIEGERKAEQERAEAEQQQRAKAQRRQQAVAGLEKGLEMSGLPKTHHTMALLAEIQQECTAQGLPELPPDLLAAEANKRYNERGVEPLKKLTGKTLLDRLGADVVRAVLIAERERRGIAAAQPRQPSQTVDRGLPEPEGDKKVYGEGEAEAMLRAMRNQRR